MKTLNIIGAGRVGRTLGYLFHHSGKVAVNAVFNRNFERASASTAFIGGGFPISKFSQLEPADFFMVTVPDYEIGRAVKALIAEHGDRLFSRESVVFHCSGVTPSSVLKPAAGLPYKTASVHPIKSFADPSIAITNFAGTYCGTEGDQEGVEALSDLFSSIGGKPFAINKESKAMYHAATAMAANNLVALIEVATDMYQSSGLDRDMAIKVLQPIVEGTIKNIFSVGTVKGLTGPIARGDIPTIEAHMRALKDTEYEEVYRHLGQWALRLAVAQGESSKEAQDEIAKLLSVNRDEPEEAVKPTHCPSMWKG